MFGIGTTELFIVLGIVLVLFGARRLPELGSGVGKAIRNFKSGISGKDEIDVTPKQEAVTEGKNPSEPADPSHSEPARPKAAQ